MRIKPVLPIVLLLALLALQSCQKASEDKPGPAPETVQPLAASEVETGKPKTITQAITNAWDSFIPFDTTNTYSTAVHALLFDRLFFLRTDGTYAPSLAISIASENNGKDVLVSLREDAKWSDGEPVTASDVVFSANLYSSPSVNGINKNIFSPFLGNLEGEDSLMVEAVDDYTVRFVLVEPVNVDYLVYNVFNLFFILPEHLLGSVPRSEIRESSYWKAPIGSGPGVLQKEITGERLEFTPNPYYYNWNANWDRYVLRVVPSSNLLAGLMNGEIDVLSGTLASLTLSDWEMAKEQPGLTTGSYPSGKYTLLHINTDKPYLTEKVRRAINLAIDREMIIDGLMGGQGLPAYSEILPSSIYYNPVAEYSYDPQAARALLEESGWDFNRVLIMGVPSGNKIREQAGIIVQQNLEAIGMRTQIATYDFTTHTSKMRAGDFDLGFVSSTAGSQDPSSAGDKYKPDAYNNYSLLSDPALYDTAKRGMYAFTEEEKKESAVLYQALLKEQAPSAYVYFENLLDAHNSRIEGIKDVWNIGFYWDVWNWKRLD